jgi:hypothetical protein
MMSKRDPALLTIEDVLEGLHETEQQIQVLEAHKLALMEKCSHKDKEGRSRLRYQRAGERYDHEYWSCDACGGGESEEPIEEKVRCILSKEMSFYQYVDEIARLMTRKNVNDVIEALPEPFATKFVEHGIECWAPTGERFVIGRPLPDEAIAAFRDWYGRRA